MFQELTIWHVTLTLVRDNKEPLLKEEVEREERDELLRKSHTGVWWWLTTDAKVKSHILNHCEEDKT